MTAPPLYTLSDVVQRYGPRTVLDIPSLTFAENRIYALQGPNGAGKTTLLNMLGFLEQPTSGEIIFRGRSVQFNAATLQELRRDVVLVDQHPILFSTSVYKNLEFGLKVRKIPADQRRRIIEQALEQVGMADFMHTAATGLSGGETQRVALARALALKPRVFLCDEPTASVDVENQEIILEILGGINASEQITIVFTTHDRRQADRIAHHTLLLEQGRLAATGSENSFPATIRPLEDGTLMCRIHPQIVLKLDGAVMPDTVATQRRIHLDPFRLDIRAAGTGSTGGENQIPAVVHQVGAENGRVRMVVEAGVLLILMMSDAQYQRKRLCANDAVTVTVRPDAIQLV
jgi:tungstate transport system ATP-binding protein